MTNYELAINNNFRCSQVEQIALILKRSELCGTIAITTNFAASFSAITPVGTESAPESLVEMYACVH